MPSIVRYGHYAAQTSRSSRYALSRVHNARTLLIVLQFGMYLMFPIGWMYYFGTNLENRFSVEGFWPTAEQSHKIPYEREEIKAEVERIQKEMRRRKERDAALLQAREAFKQLRTEDDAAEGSQASTS